MLVVRGEILYDLDTGPEAPDGVASMGGEQVREGEPVPVPERDAPLAGAAADVSERR